MPGMSNLHLAVFYTSSLANSQTDLKLNAVNDQILTIVNNTFLVPRQAQVILAFSAGANLVRVRLDTPKFRYVGLPSLTPISLTATVPLVPAVYNAMNFPLTVDPSDAISVQASSLTVGAALAYCGLWFSFGIQQPQFGPVYRLRGTAAITNAAGTWVNGSITFDQTLPNGRYQVVGLDVVGANLAFARLIFPDASFRPGVLCRQTADGVRLPQFDMGAQGVLGEFIYPSLPNLETLSVGASTAQEIFMDVIRIGES